MMGTNQPQLKEGLFSPIAIYPLVTFRILLGLILSFSMIRFLANGWVHSLYIEPIFYFPFFDWDYLSPLPGPFMYALFIALAISFFFVAIGLFYRIAIVFSFIGFTYIELLDKSNYLNHYYLVSLLCLLLCFSDAQRFASIDALRNTSIRRTTVAAWTINLIKAQLFIVYFYAGLAKLNPDWLLEALPLKIWLPSKNDIPVLGHLLNETWLAYLFSWFGALYDLSIPFLLLNKRSRPFAFILVLAFHIMTWMLFPIGVFPFVMIASSLIFFSSEWHHNFIKKILPKRILFAEKNFIPKPNKFRINKTFLSSIILIYLAFQLLFPWRFAIYPGKLFWTEQGYRFSWRVMLMEKAASATFRVVDNNNNRSWEVKNYEFLSPQQEKMMASQPDMILQYAHYLSKHYQKQGYDSLSIYVDAFASLNGSISKRFIDQKTDLLMEKDTWQAKNWILKAPDK